MMQQTDGIKQSNETINLSCETYPVEDMHNKLLITLQSGRAPDIVDVNVANSVTL